MPATAPARQVFLGRYRNLGFLGQGGMGQVFRAKEMATGRQVVVKVMHDHLAEDPRSRQNFRQEIDLMRRFRHPHVVALLDADLEGAPPCLVMEYVAGQSLEQILRQQNRLPLGRVAKLLGQLCQALHAAQAAGIVHGDLSAANVMVANPGGDSESIKVMDFGLARLAGGFFLSMEKLAGKNGGVGGGTPDFMCPEQIRGDSVDHRGDYYSVGVMLFIALTGKLPFLDNAKLEQDELVEALLQAHLHEEPPSFRRYGIVDIPAPIEAVVRRLLGKYPSERPQSAKELAEVFGKAFGAPIADDSAFGEVEPVVIERTPPLDPRSVLDRFEAWMPEQVALMKLRAFISAVGGEVAESIAGLIRVRLLDPRQQPEPEKGLFSSFGLKRRTLTPQRHLEFALHFEKKTINGRNLVEIAVTMDPGSRADAETRRGFAERICRELRAYLMIGR